MRCLSAALLLLVTACNPNVYVRDGVTDGDTFYLAPRAAADDDPAVQSWVTYSLMKAACQLAIGGDNPARENSFECELTARRHLVEAWDEHRAEAPESHEYLDTLSAVAAAGFLDEYVVHYFGERDWQIPADVDMPAFRRWQREHLRHHRPVTRLIGFWSYSPL